MHPDVPPPSLTQQVSSLRERLESQYGEGQDRAERALLAHAHSHLAQLERLAGALDVSGPGVGGPGVNGPDADAPDIDAQDMKDRDSRDSTLLGDAEWDLVHDDVAWSAEMFRIFARAPQDGPLRLDQLPGVLHPEDRRAVSLLLTEALVDGRPIDADFRLQLADGTVRPVHCVGAPRLAGDGGVHAVWLALRAR